MMSLCIEKRGTITNQTYLTTERVELSFDLPLAEMFLIFMIASKRFQKGTSLTIPNRHAPLQASESRYFTERQSSRCFICTHSCEMPTIERKCVKNFVANPGNNLIFLFRQPSVLKLFLVKPSALRKDVTAKCYGGDITKKITGKTEKREKENATSRECRNPSTSVHGCFTTQRLINHNRFMC